MVRKFPPESILTINSTQLTRYLFVQAGTITLKCTVIKNGIEKFALRQPIFMPSPVDPMYASQVIFEGISVGSYYSCPRRPYGELIDCQQMFTETESNTTWMQLLLTSRLH